MSVATESASTAPRLAFAWILGRGKDLVFYIGSALAGWLYVAVILYAAWTLDDPLTGALAEVRLGGLTIPLSLELLVVLSWALILDAPHLWGTLARTLFDPDEWRVRRREILFSFVWFAVGPVLILAPYLAGAVSAGFGRPLPRGTLALGAVVFLVFFRLWAYHHVVRQHWGFFRLYKRKAGDLGGPGEHIDTWFFNLSLYLPLAMFMTGPHYLATPGFPPLGLHHALVGSWSVSDLLYPILWVAYLAAIVVYLAHLAHEWRAGRTLNGSKLLYMLPLVPLHLAAFSHPLLAVFIVPLVTVGHNIQYHCIIYSYARNKYPRRRERAFRWVRGLFSSFAVYAAMGLVFTFALYRGPLVEWLREAAGGRLDAALFNSIGMMAGIRDPASLGLGEQVLAAVLVGFAMQHYYLDSKIWKVGGDRQVRRYLKV